MDSMTLIKQEQKEVKSKPRQICWVWRVICYIVGITSLGLAILGLILPLLPTTPFLILSAICFAKSSIRLYNWLHSNRFFGKELSRYRNREGIPLRLKVYTLSLLWITILSSVHFFVAPDRLLIKILLVLIATGVSFHVLMIKTYRASKK